MYKSIFYIQTVSGLMILSGLSVVKSKSLKAAGFADITKLGFINEKWVERRTLAAWFLFQCRFFLPHTSHSYRFRGQYYLTGYGNFTSLVVQLQHIYEVP